MELLSAYTSLFEPELIREMERSGQLANFAAGDKILEVGQIVRSIPIILSGTIKVFRVDEEGKEILLYYVQPPEGCALTFTCCMQQYSSDVRAVAEDDVELLAIPVQRMDEWLVRYPTWKNFVMRMIRDRFHCLLKTIDQIAFINLDERLLRYLKEKSRVTGSTLINQSHEEIASALATTRVVISRLLKALENQGKVLLYRNQIKLLRDL